MSIYIYTSTYIYIYTYMYVCTSYCTCVYIYIYVYVYGYSALRFDRRSQELRDVVQDCFAEQRRLLVELLGSRSRGAYKEAQL